MSHALSPADPTDLSDEKVAAVQARTVRVLVGAQAIGAVGVTIGVATSSLLAREISGSDTQAGFAQTAQVLGSAAAAYLLARLMASRGRRIGQVTGMLVGAAGALGSVLAGVWGSMPLLLVASALLGAMTAANSAARYAATDLAVPEHRARALSLVVWATTIGAVAGPNLTGPSGHLADALGLPTLTGTFLVGALAMVIAAVVVWTLLRPDPLLLAQQRHAATVGTPTTSASLGETLAAIASRPALAAAVVALASAHAVMVSVMIMTPLHMEHGGAGLEVIGLVISGHVLGMFAFSPLVGMAVDRFGRAPVLIAGAGVLLVSLLLCAQSPQGSSWLISTGLFLLGLGWSFATVSAATMVADLAPAHVRTQVQGAADVAMWLCAAAGGALAGLVVDHSGYPALAAMAAVLTCGVLAAGVVVARSSRVPG